ncbi:hypothetical protein KVF89_14425 [Nocardioides carbamazepini]|uniref:hypothetical protein n=1 Tax=Nocardioides carbamazepini TaxID=2854259 RepID=UPI0021499AD5|nr:hypothetical protein [Nocardioides carbamazepini]MCR1783732.1 hypothetical protein [Nocardioides carbamazepini]
MKPVLIRRAAAALALGALAATGLASVPSPAQAAIAYAFVDTGVSFYDYGDSPECSLAGVLPDPDDAAWSDNGVPVSQSFSTSGTFTNADTASDIVDVRASGSVTVSSTPFTGGAVTITGTATASSSATSRLASTECDTSARAEPGASGTLVLTQPMWVTLTASGDGNGNGGASIQAEDGGAFIAVGKRGSGSTTTLLPAGEVYFDLGSSASSSAYGTTEGARSYTGTYKIELQPVGTASPLAGKGQAYTVFGARDCATGNVSAVITKKAAKKAKQVTIMVNGKKVVNLKGKKLAKAKNKTIVLPAAPSGAAEVVAKVKLKNGKKVDATRSYLACS